jgi:hypothetical protein
MADALGVKVEGLREFRRDLKRLDAGANKALSAELRETGGQALVTARSLAPRVTGKLADSLRLSVTQKAVTIYSTLPQAPVIHYGGTISPRGVPISFPRTEFITRAVEQHGDELLENVGRDIDRAASSAGWK